MSGANLKNTPRTTQSEARADFAARVRARARAIAWTVAWAPLLAIAMLLAARDELRMADGRLYDLRVRMHAPLIERTAPLVWIALDDESLARLEPSVGRWPWPRAVWAGVMDYADAASVIALDILLTEEDRSYPGSDDVLAESAEHHGRVVAAAIAPRPGEPPRKPYPRLAQAVRAVGHAQIEPDPDGVVRRYSGFLRADDGLLPSLAHAVAAVYLNSPAEALPKPQGFWMAPSGTPPEIYSAADVIDAWMRERTGQSPAIARDAFREKIVLIGSFATGLPADQKITSRSPDEAGPLIVGTAIDNLLSGRFYERPPRVVDDALAALAAFAPLLLGAMRPRRFALAITLFAAAYIALAIAATIALRVMMPMAAPMLAGAISSTGLLVVYWDRDRRERVRLEMLEAAKQRFTDMLVHDLRNRTYSAQATLKLLDKRIESAASRDLLGVAAAAVQRMSIEVQSLLDIRKMEEGRLPLARADVSADELLRETAAEYASAAAAADISIRVESAPVLLFADRALLARALGNLIFNAVQHARAGTPLILRCSIDGGEAVISVSNSGPLLSDEARSALFQPFAVRADQPRARGTGLGLTFCKLVAETHGGSIGIESPAPETGDGVRVALRLPVHLDKRNAEPDNRAA